MTWWIVGGVALVLLIAVLVVAFGNRYAKVFTDRHLQEFCEKLDVMRGAACADVRDVDEDLGALTPEEVLRDPRNAQTDAGMRMSYTVSRDPERPGKLAHHLAMSHEDKLPSGSFARFFAGLAIVRFGLDAGDVAAQRSENLVTHLLWEIPEDENATFAATPEELPSVEDLPALRERARQIGSTLPL